MSGLVIGPLASHAAGVWHARRMATAGFALVAVLIIGVAAVTVGNRLGAVPWPGGTTPADRSTVHVSIPAPATQAAQPLRPSPARTHHGAAIAGGGAAGATGGAGSPVGVGAVTPVTGLAVTRAPAATRPRSPGGAGVVVRRHRRRSPAAAPAPPPPSAPISASPASTPVPVATAAPSGNPNGSAGGSHSGAASSGPALVASTSSSAGGSHSGALAQQSGPTTATATVTDASKRGDSGLPPGQAKKLAQDSGGDSSSGHGNGHP